MPLPYRPSCASTGTLQSSNSDSRSSSLPRGTDVPPFYTRPKRPSSPPAQRPVHRLEDSHTGYFVATNPTTMTPQISASLPRSTGNLVCRGACAGQAGRPQPRKREGSKAWRSSAVEHQRHTRSQHPRFPKKQSDPGHHQAGAANRPGTLRRTVEEKPQSYGGNRLLPPGNSPILRQKVRIGIHRTPPAPQQPGRSHGELHPQPPAVGSTERAASPGFGHHANTHQHSAQNAYQMAHQISIFGKAAGEIGGLATGQPGDQASPHRRRFCRPPPVPLSTAKLDGFTVSRT